MRPLNLLGKTIDVVVIGAALIVLFRPGGLATQVFLKWTEQRATLRSVQANWTQLAEVPSLVGDPRSAVSIIEFMDYQCPACRRAHFALQSLTRDAGVRVTVRHLPLAAIHPRARDAALASICAEEADIFQAYHDLLLSSDAWQQASSPWGTLAREAGAQDTVAFNACLGTDRPSSRLTADSMLAALIGVRTVPTFLTQRRIVPGLPSDSVLFALAK